MCGFIGKISFEDFDYKNVIECNDLIECRGPDSLSSHNGKKNGLCRVASNTNSFI